MAQATTTTLGEIILAGDLSGNDATSPQLRISGVTPGTYAMLQRASIDSKGRVTSIGTAQPADIAAVTPDADGSGKGIVQVGDGLEVSAGVISLPNASATTKGIVSISDSRLAISAGVLSSAIPDAVQNSTKGLVQITAGTGLSISAGMLSVDLATSSTPGRVAIGTGFLKNQSAGALVVNSARLTTSAYPNNEPGVCRPGTNMAVAGDGTLSHTFPDATGAVKGIVQIGTNLSVVDGVVSYTGGADATGGSAGIMQVGSGLSVSAGIISVADATPSSKGIVSVGSGLSVSSGVISASLADATPSAKGVVQIGTGLVVSGGLVQLDLPNATSSTMGVVQNFSGSGITINDSGVMSSSGTLATASTKGVIIPGTSMDVVNGELSIAIASTTKKGLMQAGSGLTATAGVVDVDSSFMRLSTSYVRTFNEKQGSPRDALGTHTSAGYNGYPNYTSETNFWKVSLANQASNITFILPESPGTVSGTVFRIVVSHTGTSSLNITVRSFNGTGFDVRGPTAGSTKPFAQFTASDGTQTRTWTTLPVTSGTGVDVFEVNVIPSGYLVLVTPITGY